MGGCREALHRRKPRRVALARLRNWRFLTRKWLIFVAWVRKSAQQAPTRWVSRCMGCGCAALFAAVRVRAGAAAGDRGRPAACGAAGRVRPPDVRRVRPPCVPPRASSAVGDGPAPARTVRPAAGASSAAAGAGALLDHPRAAAGERIHLAILRQLLLACTPATAARTPTPARQAALRQPRLPEPTQFQPPRSSSASQHAPTDEGAERPARPPPPGPSRTPAPAPRGPLRTAPSASRRSLRAPLPTARNHAAASCRSFALVRLPGAPPQAGSHCPKYVSLRAQIGESCGAATIAGCQTSGKPGGCEQT